MTAEPGSVTGGVDAHPDLHVAAAAKHLGAVLGTESFPTTAAGCRRLLTWLRGFGPLHQVSVEGTGSYGSALARYLERVHVRLTRTTKATAPHLVQTHGVGTDTASTLLISAGDNRLRLHSESSWAALLGSKHIPASSGKTNRHRLSRGRERQANAALWRIAIVRMGSEPNTRTYVDKRVKEGKTKTEAIRCLKRYIARELYAKLPREALRG